MLSVTWRDRHRHGRHLTHEEKFPTSLSLHGSLFTKTLPCWKCVLRTICSHGRSAQSCHCLYSDKYSWDLSKAQKICSKAQHPWLHSLSPIKRLYLLFTVFFFKYTNLVVKSVCCSSRDYSSVPRIYIRWQDSQKMVTPTRRCCGSVKKNSPHSPIYMNT